MNRQGIADKIRTAGSAVETVAAHLADKIDPPTFGVRIVWDEYHETVGSYAYDTDEETREAEAEEAAKLASGEWAAVGVIAYRRDSHGVEREDDTGAALWTVVDSIELPDRGIDRFVSDPDELGPYLREVFADLRAEAGV